LLRGEIKMRGTAEAAAMALFRALPADIVKKVLGMAHDLYKAEHKGKLLHSLRYVVALPMCHFNRWALCTHPSGMYCARVRADKAQMLMEYDGIPDTEEEERVRDLIEYEIPMPYYLARVAFWMTDRPHVKRTNYRHRHYYYDYLNASAFGYVCSSCLEPRLRVVTLCRHDVYVCATCYDQGLGDCPRCTLGSW